MCRCPLPDTGTTVGHNTLGEVLHKYKNINNSLVILVKVLFNIPSALFSLPAAYISAMKTPEMMKFKLLGLSSKSTSFKNYRTRAGRSNHFVIRTQGFTNMHDFAFFQIKIKEPMT